MSALALPIQVKRVLPTLLTAAAMLWIVFSLAGIVWSVLTPPSAVQAPETEPALAPVAPAVSLAQYHLFGSAATSAAGSYANAPDTALQLILRGTSSHHDLRLARAVIAEAQKESVVKVDDVLSGARIVAIFPDRVVLDASGRIEVLRLKALDGTRAAQDGAVAAGAPPPGGVALGSDGRVGLAAPAPPAGAFVNPLVSAAPIDWEAVRQQAIADPSSLAKAFSIAPVMIDGKLAGVRLSSNQFGQQLAEAGLQGDDIVTAVNGRPLTSIEAGYAAIESLKTAGAITLTVKRGNSEKTLPAIRMSP